MAELIIQRISCFVRKSEQFVYLTI